MRHKVDDEGALAPVRPARSVYAAREKQRIEQDRPEIFHNTLWDVPRVCSYS